MAAEKTASIVMTFISYKKKKNWTTWVDTGNHLGPDN